MQKSSRPRESTVLRCVARGSCYLTGITIGGPFSATRKSMARARSVALGLLMRWITLFGFEPKSPVFITCVEPPSGS